MEHQPRKSHTVKYVAIGCVGLVLVVGCAFGGCMLMTGGAVIGVLDEVAAPAQQTKGFFADLRARNYAGALARMSPTYQASHSLAAFQQSVDAIAALTQQTDDTIDSRSVTGANAAMSGALSTPAGDVHVDVALTQHGAVWQIDTAVVGGAPLQ